MLATAALEVLSAVAPNETIQSHRVLLQQRIALEARNMEGCTLSANI